MRGRERKRERERERGRAERDKEIFCLPLQLLKNTCTLLLPFYAHVLDFLLYMYEYLISKVVLSIPITGCR